MKKITAILFVFLLLACTSVQAQDARWYDSVEMQGFVSTSFTYNLNTPASGENGFRIFDRHHNSFNFDVFQLVLKKDAAKAGEAGFRFDGIFGQLPMYTASSGLFGGQNIDVLQAYATYIIPIGSGLTLDGGKFLTHMGYELIEGRDGWNDNISRSYCFGYAIPFAHTGLRARYGFGESVSAMVMLANGWDNAVENNSNKTFGAQLAITPMKDLSIIANAIYGAEGSNDNSNNTSVIDLVASWSASKLITIGANVDMGTAQGAAAEGKDAAWTGYAGYLRFNLFDSFSLSLRAEQFDDTDGVRTGGVQKFTGITVTPEYRPTDNMVIRAEFRMDSSDKEVFEDGDSFRIPSLQNSDAQSTIGLNMLFYF
ncbi:MAG: outer membrane beta-barrel protein [Bacteroidota bacterium]